MKKIWIVVVLIMCTILCACGESDVGESIPATTEATVPATTEAVLQDDAELDTDYYVGTWKGAYIEQNGERADISTLESNGIYSLSNMTLILREDGKYQFYVALQNEIGDWTVAENGVITDGELLTLNDDMLAIDFGDYGVLLTKYSNETVFTDEKTYNEEDFFGTWTICGAYTADGEDYFTLAQIESANATLAQSHLIFAEGNNGFACIEDLETHITWTYADKAIISGSIKIGYTFDLLCMTDNSYIYLFIKTSDDCAIPEKEDGIRPEFKEAMDSYEEFFKEYCELMKKIEENPSDMELLISYSQYMAQYAETMQKMETLNDGTLNDAELQYYLEVTGRITKMLMEAGM